MFPVRGEKDDDAAAAAADDDDDDDDGGDDDEEEVTMTAQTILILFAFSDFLVISVFSAARNGSFVCALK